MKDDRNFEMLNQIQVKQVEMAEDISAIKQHLKDMNGSIQNQKTTCNVVSTGFRKEIDKIKLQIATASGGIIALVWVLSQFGIL